MAGHNNFINEWVTVNFNDLLSRITSGQDSTPYMSIDRHLVRIKFKTTASDANRPTSLKIALSALKNWHLEWSNEHLNTRPLTKNTPRYLHLWPFDLETGVRVAFKVGNRTSKFGHARPLRSGIIRYVRDGRTDRRTDKSNAYCPLPYTVKNFRKYTDK